MSIDAAVARIGQIETMISSLAGPTLPPPTPAGGFDRQLAQAQASGPVSPPALAGAAVADTGASGGGQYAAQIAAAASKYGVDPAVLKGLIRQESNFNPSAKSATGALGLTQLMPGTAAALGVTNPLDPAQAIDGGARYLRQQLDAFGGDVRKALAAYNAGPGAVKRYGGVPPYGETQNYVRQVLAYADQYRRGLGSGPTPTAAA